MRFRSRTLAKASGSPADQAADAPLLLELISTVLEAGAPVATAIVSVADAACTSSFTSDAESPAAILLRVGKLMTLGADAVQAWHPCRASPALESLATTGVRCASSGARLAGALRATAARLRVERRARMEQAAGRLAVWSMLPLGLCFLPAFVCVGIVPTLIGLGRQALGP